MVPNMKAKYTAEVAPALMKKFQYESAMQIPKLDKIVINVGCGKEANGNSKVIEAIVRDITLISGQKPIITHAKKSIANFKLRDGMPVGVKVTLRRDRMWEFLDRLFNVALPRVRDFRGINGNAFDGRGNYALGLNEQLIDQECGFPAGGYGHRTERADGCCSGGVPRLLSGPLEHGADSGFAGDRVTRQAVYRSWTGVLRGSE